jgi:prevent-host-death family protein
MTTPPENARILYMETLSVADARARFSRIVDSAATTHERFDVTRNGRRVAVVIGADDFDALLETVAVLSDAQAVTGIAAGLADFAEGRVVTADDVAEAMREAGRRTR